MYCGMPKGTCQAEETLMHVAAVKIKPVALAIIDISEGNSQPTENSTE